MFGRIRGYISTLKKQGFNVLDVGRTVSGCTVSVSSYFIKISFAPNFDKKILSTVKPGFKAQNLLKFCPKYCH
ncbi:MAG: hypothetical protein DCF14_24010 [Phormidesmis priestleyi]|nr:MAG: hypothetical protein DCF14_24010 [Phormidesmis priestleyi]